MRDTRLSRAKTCDYEWCLQEVAVRCPKCTRRAIATPPALLVFHWQGAGDELRDAGLSATYVDRKQSAAAVVNTDQEWRIPAVVGVALGSDLSKRALLPDDDVPDRAVALRTKPTPHVQLGYKHDVEPRLTISMECRTCGWSEPRKYSKLRRKALGAIHAGATSFLA